MEKLKANLRTRIAPLVALAIVISLYGFCVEPAFSSGERAELSSRFKFTGFQLAQPAGYTQKSNREVNPALKRLSAWISSVGASVALNDLDGDGLSNDLCYVDTRIDQVIVSPAPSTPSRYEPFTLKPEGVAYDADTTAPMGCLPGDYNEDGRMDVLVYFWGRSPIIYLKKSDEKKLGSGDYQAVDAVENVERWYTSAATQSDLDGDGHLDLIIGNYFQSGARLLDANAPVSDKLYDAKAKSFNGGWNNLLLWTGASSGTSPTVTFKDVKESLSEEVARGWTLAVGAADLDGDLLPEIYFANDFGPDRLLHNRSTPGNLKFEILEGKKGFSIPASFVLGHDSFKGMGVDFSDVNGDGLLDIYVSNIATTFGLQESHFLWLSTGETALMNSGIAPYRQASEELGLSRSGWSWDCRMDDFDNDGSLEAVQATGFIKGTVNRWPELQSLGTANSRIMDDPKYWPGFKPGDDVSGHESNAFFARGRDGRFYNIAAELGLDGPLVSRGIAIADVDGDGRLDFALANQWSDSYFYHNGSQSEGSYIGLRLVKSIKPSASENSETGLRFRPAIGAEVKVYLPNGKSLVAQVDGGSGHSGKRSPEIHFGLGKLASADNLKVDIKWRGNDGQVRNRTLSLSPEWHTVVLD